MERRRKIGLAVGGGILVAIGLLAFAAGRVRTGVVADAIALVGEARVGRVTLELPPLPATGRTVVAPAEVEVP